MRGGEHRLDAHKAALLGQLRAAHCAAAPFDGDAAWLQLTLTAADLGPRLSGRRRPPDLRLLLQRNRRLEQNWREWQKIVGKAPETAELLLSREALARAAIPAKRGRPGLDWRITRTVTLLACVWREQTGRKAGATQEGHFEGFVSEFLTATRRKVSDGRVHQLVVQARKKEPRVFTAPPGG